MTHTNTTTTAISTPTSAAMIVPVLSHARAERHHSHGAPVLSTVGAESCLLAKKPPIQVSIDDLHCATDHAPIYSSPAVRFRSVLASEDIGQPIYWALDLASLKHVLTHALLLPWDSQPSMRGMYQQLLVPISERVREIISELKSVTDFTPEIIAQLNDAIPHRRIEWIGTLRDLTHGNCETAREIRFRYFLATDAMQLEDAFADTPAEVNPIPTAENEQFLDFLRGVPIGESLAGLA